MHQVIQQLWESRRWPIQSGIYFADGKVVPMRISMAWDTEQSKIVDARALSPTELSCIPEFRDNKMTHLGELCEQTELNLNLHAYAGEGAWGSEGFIVLTKLDSDKLIWAAYFDKSNPFVKVSFEDSTVIAVSTHGYVWQLPQAQPESLKVMARPLHS